MKRFLSILIIAILLPIQAHSFNLWQDAGLGFGAGRTSAPNYCPVYSGTRTASSEAEGATVGPELSPDVYFADTNKWQLQTGWSLSGNKAVANAAAGYIIATPTTMPCTEGNRYKIELIVDSFTSGVLLVDASYGNTVMAITSAGTYSGEFIAKVSGFLTLTAAGGFTGSVSKWSVKLVTPVDTTAPNPVFLAVTGDSIAEGHNAGANFHSILDGGPSATTTISSQIMYQMTQTGTPFIFENLAKSGQTYAWVESTGFPAAANTYANTIIIHAGINDVMAGRTWNDIQANLNQIKTLLKTGQKLFISEILPSSTSNDTQAVTIRTINTNLAAWGSINGVTIIKGHDAMGENRGSTGQLDNLKTAYSQDGVHLSSAGVSAIAVIWLNALKGYCGAKNVK